MSHPLQDFEILEGSIRNPRKENGTKKWNLTLKVENENTPAMVELSHPMRRFPRVAATATITTSLMVCFTAQEPRNQNPREITVFDLQNANPQIVFSE